MTKQNAIEYKKDFLEKESIKILNNFLKKVNSMTYTDPVYTSIEVGNEDLLFLVDQKIKDCGYDTIMYKSF